MRRFEIVSTAKRPLRFVATQIFGGDFIVIGESAAEVNVEGIIDCLREEDGFKYGKCRIMWVTRAQDSITEYRMVRELHLPETGGRSPFEWGDPYSFEHLTEDLQKAVIACEDLLAAPGQLQRVGGD
ncbi:hypothetical protein [Bradyrhizobium sp. CB2312]|uniref:hypothetical protein n=1 Tax=Bradyrhizobium sp. CB2312 TaxID=3039155 RepID=UPI0024B11430|nr:hypothetical protein [Bradyrhizobium sp. CB2312]WFU74264.1 hypothetical protein QA642_09550 [Bradyrhizobium sp. CB2312]